MAVNGCLFIHHHSGANHALRGKRFAKLLSEIKAGRGGPEVTDLVLSGYEGFLGPDGNIWDFEALTAEILEKHRVAS
jgi:hypothetical protein